MYDSIRLFLFLSGLSCFVGPILVDTFFCCPGICAVLSVDSTYVWVFTPFKETWENKWVPENTACTYKSVQAPVSAT